MIVTNVIGIALKGYRRGHPVVCTEIISQYVAKGMPKIFYKDIQNKFNSFGLLYVIFHTTLLPKIEEVCLELQHNNFACLEK